MLQNEGIEKYFQVSSAGTKNWNIGLRPDQRAQKICAKYGYHISPHKRSQKISSDEIKNSDYLIAMDRRIADELGNGKNVHLLLDFVEDIINKDIQDPYPTDTFPEAFYLIEQGVKDFYKFLKQQLSQTNCLI